MRQIAKMSVSQTSKYLLSCTVSTEIIPPVVIIRFVLEEDGVKVSEFDEMPANGCIDTSVDGSDPCTVWDNVLVCYVTRSALEMR